MRWMPWKERSVMDERMRFVIRLKDGETGLRGELRQTEVGNSCRSLKNAGERMVFDSV